MAVRHEKVTEVINGDTFRTDGRKKRVRLSVVNAPGMETALGKSAARLLKKLIEGKTVEVDTLLRGKSFDWARVKVDGKSVNLAINRKIGY